MPQVALIAALRLVTGIGQFAVLLLLATFLSIEDLGTYSIIAIYLTYATQLAGLNFHTFVLREQASLPRERWPGLLQHQWVFLVISTALVAGAASLLDLMNWLSLPSFGWFIALLALTVANTQQENFLVGAGKPVSAALSLLVRTAWIYGLAMVHILWPGQMTLDSVLSAWVVGESAGLVLMLAILAQARLLPDRWSNLDLQWLKRGTAVGARYTVLGLFLIVSISIQRVALANLDGETAVGIFHFFFAISVFGPNLLEASLYAVLPPRLIAATRATTGLPMPPLWVFAFLGGLGTIGLTVLYFILPMALELIGKPELLPNRSIFAFTAGYAVLYTVARVFHYSLYAAGADRWLTLVNGLTCLLACATAFVLVGIYGLTGAAWALVLTGAALLVGNGLPFFNAEARRRALSARTLSIGA